MLTSCGKKRAIDVGVLVRHDINIEDGHDCRRPLRISEAPSLLEDPDRAEEIYSRLGFATIVHLQSIGTDPDGIVYSVPTSSCVGPN
jgi:hypothetical protein